MPFHVIDQKLAGLRRQLAGPGSIGRTFDQTICGVVELIEVTGAADFDASPTIRRARP